MNLEAKKILIIDLQKKDYEVKSYTELMKYVGGVGIGIKLLKEFKQEDPIIFSVGPLNGIFPYASKTSVVFLNNGILEDVYLGGSLSTRIHFAGVDAIVIKNAFEKKGLININDEDITFPEYGVDISSLGLPGKRSVINFEEKVLLLGHYFKSHEDLLGKKLINKNIQGMVITGGKTSKINNKESVSSVVETLLKKINLMEVEKGFFPSCSGCPMGCEKSEVGEIGGNILVHCLVGCQYAEKIYSDISIVFSCLNSLGYNYTHEDLENLPALINSEIKELEK